MSAARRAEVVPNADSVVQELAVGASVEMTPRQLRATPVLTRLLPRGATVYVPFPLKARRGQTVEACGRLLEAGMQPVAHVPARSLESASELAAWLTELADVGVDSLMLVAGDRTPQGPFADTLDVLDSGLLGEFGFRRLGITAYPEGHPEIADDALERALWQKAEYAAETGTEMWIVTQFVFSPEPALAWLRKLRQAGPMLPVRIGMPAPARASTLLVYAAQCGVGVSAQVLSRRPAVARMLGGWSPNAVVRGLARQRVRDPSIPLAGIHLFTFGGLTAAAEWLRRRRTLEGQEPEGGRYGELLPFPAPESADTGADEQASSGKRTASEPPST